MNRLKLSKLSNIGIK